MKISKEFILKEMGNFIGEQTFIVIAVGETAQKFKAYLTLNESGAFIFNKLQEGVNDISDIVKSMLELYDAPKEVIEKDVLAVVDVLKKSGVINE